MRAAVRELVRRHRRLVGDDRERGTSMVELIVAMVIMTICGAIFTGAMVTLFRVNNAAQAVTNSAQQTNQAYQSLDRLARYANAVSTPGVSAAGGTGDWYVELRSTVAGVQTCTQLRVDRTTQVLQQRTWPNASPPSTPPAWQALASSLTNGAAASGSADQPFVLVTPGATSTRQRVTFTLVSQAGPGPDARSSRSSFTLSVLNSSVPQSSGSAICAQLGRP